MLIVGSALIGYELQAEDGLIGTVTDFLLDDRSWRFRWLVIQTGSWHSERQVLIHPSAIRSADHDRKTLAVRLSRSQVMESPDVSTDEPVSKQKEVLLYDYYGWDPLWGTGLYDPGMLGNYIGPPRYFGAKDMDRAMDMAERVGGMDPDLRSLTVLKSYYVHATDGMIGHVENLLIDDQSWDVRYLIIDTSNWWMGKHVLISPHAVTDVSWSSHEISLDVSKEKVRSSPAWDPMKSISEMEERELHTHYAWPGYGWR
jgi:uncharacterized protein YrrD